MKRFVVPGVSILGFLWISIAAAAEPATPTAAAVIAEFNRMAGLPLWPGFDPKTVPLAIYDGERTVLVRHPSPPPGFKREGEVWVYPGQHPEMRANTSMELGGATTATLLLDSGKGRDARHWASVMMHETFHVFQRKKHPSWAGNEAELFTYPLEDAGRLASRRLETDALRRALASQDAKQAACWTVKALALRRQRYGSLPAGSEAYEQGTELNEGLATFIENLALGETKGPDLPAGEYPAGDVRSRAYAIGYADATLLDRFDPGWRKALEVGQGASLDELLTKALNGKPVSACAFSAEESAAALARAKEDIARFVQEKQQLREAFLSRPGWRIEILSSAQPLWPQGFDPLNVVALGKGEVLHRRWVKLGNGDSTIEVLDRESLTEGAGEHPLFNGLRRLIITGLPDEPKVRQEGGFLVLDAGGVTAKLKGAVAETSGSVVKIKMP
ncbi:MAG TPA: hypothetical protein VGX68_14235 [Thermoanaerobaculia bacterium]|jgi:hypothetical protein|nr:hypothetical protein [Thermoanaerobaculia bacterium]